MPHPVDDTDGASASWPPATGDAGVDNRLWIERIARYRWLGTASDRLFDDPRYAPYLFVGILLALDFGVLGAYGYLVRGFHPFLTNPATVLIPLGLLGGILAAQRLRDGHHDAVTSIFDRPGTERYPQSPGLVGRALLGIDATWTADRPPRAALEDIVSDRVTALLVLVGWSFHAIWILFTPGARAFVFETQGIVGPIRFLLLMPLVYYVVAADLAAMLVGIHLLLPLKLKATGVINFQDPIGYGHLKPVGDLVKSGTLYYLGGVTGFVLVTGAGAYLAARGAPLPGATPVNTIGVGLLIVAGAVIFALPVIVVHGHMKHAKRDKLTELAREVKRAGPADDVMMFPETEVPETVDASHDYIQYSIKI